jgi:hypothetical protein
MSGGETFSFTDGVDLARQLAESERVRDCYARRWAQVATGEHFRDGDERLSELTADFIATDDIHQLLEDITTSSWFSQRTTGGAE